jgi:hypothetical protein
MHVLHRLVSERVDNPLGVKILLAIGVLLEQFSRTVAQEFVVCYLNFESAGIPRIVQLEVVRVDERYLLIYDHASSFGNIGRSKYLLGALAARIFYSKREPQNCIRKRSGH